MCIPMGKRLAFFLTVFFYFKVFGVKMQKSTFKKNGFESSFIKLTFISLRTVLSDLKNAKQLKFCLG